MIRIGKQGRRKPRMLTLFMTIIRQMPHQITSFNWGFVVFVIFVGITQITPQLLAIVKHRDDLVTILESVLVFIVIGLTFTKGVCLTCYAQQIWQLMHRIRADWQVWAADPEVYVLHKYAERGRKMMLVWTVAFYSMGIIFVIQPAIPKLIDTLLRNGTETGVFPVPVEYYYFDGQEYYFYIIALMCLCILVGFLYSTPMDFILIISVQHSCAIFTLLGHKLKEIGTNVESTEKLGNDDASIKKDVNCKYIAWLVKRHVDAIAYAELIESTFTWGFFYMIGLNMLLISVSGYQILKCTAGIQETGKFLVSSIGAFINIYIESYMAQILMDHSSSIYYYLQSSQWYNQSPNIQKLVCFMIMRSSKACKLTAGKMGVMCIETFATILKTSMSCLTVLRSM